MLPLQAVSPRDAFQRRTARVGQHGLPARPRCVLSPVHAGQILRVGTTERDVLPRWGIRSPIRNSQPEPGARTGRIGWSSREHYLEVVVPATLAANQDVLKAHKVADDTLRRWIAAETLYVQERRSGRTCIVRPSTLAQLLGCAKRTVQRCRKVANELGLRVEVVKGRMLNLEETLTARAAGSPQRGLSTVADFCIPADAIPPPQPVDHVTPTRGSSHYLGSESLIPSQPRLTAKTTSAATRHRHQHKRAETPAWKLAHSLILRIPYLAGLKPGRLAPLVTRFAKATRPWTASQLVEAMDRINIESDGPHGIGYTSPVRSEVRHPLAFVKWYFDQIDHDADHPHANTPPRTNPPHDVQPRPRAVPMPPELRQMLRDMRTRRPTSLPGQAPDAAAIGRN